MTPFIAILALSLAFQEVDEIVPLVIEVPANTPPAKYRFGCVATFSSSGMSLTEVPADSAMGNMRRPGRGDAYFIAEPGDTVIAIKHSDGRWISPQSPEAFAYIVNSFESRRASILLRDKNGTGTWVYDDEMLDPKNRNGGGRREGGVVVTPRDGDRQIARLISLVIVQSDDKTIGKAAARSKELFLELLREPTVQSYSPLTVVIEGADYNRADILDVVRRIEVGPNDSIFCYVNGHGAHDDRLRDYCGGHYFDTAGVKLKRTELRKELESKGARFTCLISDSCNVACELPPSQVFMSKVDVMNKKFDSLFFKSKGFVDLNSSASGQYSWTDVFAPVFFNALSESPSRFAQGGFGRTIPPDQATDWRSFADELSGSVQTYYGSVRRYWIDKSAMSEKEKRTQTMLRNQPKQTVTFFTYAD